MSTRDTSKKSSDIYGEQWTEWRNLCGVENSSLSGYGSVSQCFEGTTILLNFVKCLPNNTV
jgi:hypothetical protein